MKIRAAVLFLSTILMIAAIPCSAYAMEYTALALSETGAEFGVERDEERNAIVVNTPAYGFAGIALCRCKKI